MFFIVETTALNFLDSDQDLCDAFYRYNQDVVYSKFIEDDFFLKLSFNGNIRFDNGVFYPKRDFHDKSWTIEEMLETPIDGTKFPQNVFMEIGDLSPETKEEILAYIKERLDHEFWNPQRITFLLINLKLTHRKYDDAISICDFLRAKYPDFRTSDVSDEGEHRGLSYGDLLCSCDKYKNYDEIMQRFINQATEIINEYSGFVLHSSASAIYNYQNDIHNKFIPEEISIFFTNKESYYRCLKETRKKQFEFEVRFCLIDNEEESEIKKIQDYVESDNMTFARLIWRPSDGFALTKSVNTFISANHCKGFSIGFSLIEYVEKFSSRGYKIILRQEAIDEFHYYYNGYDSDGYDRDGYDRDGIHRDYKYYGQWDWAIDSDDSW